MKSSTLHELKMLLSSLLVGAGIILVGVVGWYLLFGSCGWVSSAIAISKMNDIADGWQAAKESVTPDYEDDGRVENGMESVMQSWRDLMGSINVPACLVSSRDSLASAIETDYHALFIGDESLLNTKRNMLEAGDEEINIYRQSIVVVEACMPLCNLDQDVMYLRAFVFE